MKTYLSINSVLIYGQKNDKLFTCKFSDKLNIIYGKNTAGKSTLIQLILFAFGINDGINKLEEVFSEDVFVRLDCTIKNGEEKFPIVIIRSGSTQIIKEPSGKIIKFYGINSNNSVEHIKLKRYFSELFNFSLLLESNSVFKEAPIETIFLPYYVSQDVGWVYLRQSFTNLSFYRSFKEDFLDYYLGIESSEDRIKKRKLEKDKYNIEQKISFLSSVERDSDSLFVSRIIDESLSGKANELVDNISKVKDKLLNFEKDYVIKSNELTFHNQRLSIVSKVKRNLNKQEPGKDQCPSCSQELPINIEEVYQHLQAKNDTVSTERQLKEKIQIMQSQLNTLNKKIEDQRDELKVLHGYFNKYTESSVSLESWINDKANVKLSNNLISKIGELVIELNSVKEKLREYKTDEQIIFERERKNRLFSETYISFKRKLGLLENVSVRENMIYEISNFPYQGVRLHLAVLSYHFAFNRVISDTPGIHRLPFILDSVFKEDIDGGNRVKILEFINSNFPNDTQTILSIADDKFQDSRIEEYSRTIFKDNGNLICLGGGSEEKSLLQKNDNSQKELIEETFLIIEDVN